jgi:hypothetical protein
MLDRLEDSLKEIAPATRGGPSIARAAAAKV